jgi:hypothetical protein
MAAEGRQLAYTILMNLENQLLNALASEYKVDIIKVIDEELAEVRRALQWIRKLPANIK